MSGEPRAEAVHLLRFLRDLADSRRIRVPDLSAYDQVHWLADLPGEVHLRTEARPGEVLFGLPPIPLEPPASAADFDAWLALRRWYRVLRGLAEILDAPSSPSVPSVPSVEAAPSASRGLEPRELVLAVGLLTLQSGTPEGGVRDHLLTTPVRIEVDPRTERIDVLLGDRPTTLQDRDVLEGFPGFQPSRTEWLRQAVRDGRGAALQDSVSDVLRKWGSSALAEPVPFREDWTDDGGNGGARLRLAPALVLRRPPGSPLVDLLDDHLATLTDSPEDDPRPPEPGPADPRSAPAVQTEPVWEPTPTGPDDPHSAAVVRTEPVWEPTSRPPEAGSDDPRFAAVVRTGPVPAGIVRFLRPGAEDRLAHLPERGAVGELLTALLARGQRVLVVSGRPKEIRDALPPELAGLAVTVNGCHSDLAERMRELAVRFASYDPERYDRALAEHQARANALEQEAASLRSRLAAFRQGERLDLAPGYSGSREEVEAALSPGFPWLPVIAGLPETPPLTAAEAAELTELLATGSPRRQARTGQRLPGPSELPGADQVRSLIAMAQVAAPDPAGDLAQRLADRDPAVLERLEEHAATVQSTLAELGGGWDGADWTARALRESLAGPAPLWEYLGDLAGRASAADRALRAVGGHWVVLPPGPEGELIEAALELRGYLASGGALRRGPLKPAVQRRADPLLTEATVDGGPPRTPEQLDVVIAALESRRAVAELVEAWRSVGVELADSQALDGLVAQLAALHSRLAQVRKVLEAVAATGRLLRRIDLRVPLRSPAAWQDYRRALELVRIRRRASTAWAALASLRQTVELRIREGQAPPELQAAAAALSARDLPAYERCLAALEEARAEQAAQLRCEELLEWLRLAHPVLAELPRLVPEEWEAAWHWAHVSSLLLEHPRSPEDIELSESLAHTETQSREAAATLAFARAWGRFLSRPGTGQWSGAGQGPDAGQWPGAGQEPDVERWQGADGPPLWIMRLAEAPVVLPAASDAFDVVVVDHAGEGAEALFLLWSAARVVILGEGGAVAPDRSLTPESTFFGALAARFPVLEMGAEAGRKLPQPPPEPPSIPRPRSGGEPPGIEPGRSIVGYRRAELVALVRGLAADTALTDEQIVDYARDLLDCPEDEQLIVEARLRYAVQSLRE